MIYLNFFEKVSFEKIQKTKKHAKLPSVQMITPRFLVFFKDHELTPCFCMFFRDHRSHCGVKQLDHSDVVHWWGVVLLEEK